MISERDVSPVGIAVVGAGYWGPNLDDLAVVLADERIASPAGRLAGQGSGI